MNLYEIMHPLYRWPDDQILHVFETFAGVGAQAKSLERLSVPHIITGISEIDKDAILSYAAIHCQLNEVLDTYDFPEKEVMIHELQQMDVGFDFKNNQHTITEKTRPAMLKKYYLANVLSGNLGNVSQIHAKDLPDIDLLTYSFPCQDLSRAGRMKGMDKDDHTRSGLLWEIERILEEAERLDRLPKLLLMENVPEVIGTRNRHNFMSWFYKLERLGYQSYFKIVDAADHGIPQHRERCFMISILGEYSYSFPRCRKLHMQMKDLLEDEIDIRYFQTYRSVCNYLTNPKERKISSIPVLNKEISSGDTTINAIRQNQSKRSIICINSLLKNGSRVSQTNRILDSEGIAVTLTTGYTGYYLVSDERVPNELAASEKVEKIVLDGRELGVIRGRLVRRLTALEAFRLMGFDDHDVEEMRKAGVSEVQLIRQAGNSIVVDVLEALLGQLFNKKGELWNKV